MKKRKHFLGALMSALFIFGLTVSCSSDDSDGPANPENAKVAIKMTDAPGDYDAVYIDVQDVMVQMDGDDNWVSVGDVDAKVYNLLELTGGASVTLGDDEIPAGKLHQIRLVLGDDNTVVIDGETYPLKTPSAQQSGLKLQVNEDLEGGFTYEFLLDFDADKSIVNAGNSGNIILKPVIRVSTAVASGKIMGSVSPADFQSMAWVVADQDTISAYTNDNGVYVLNGVPEGSYQVHITPDTASGYAPATINDVNVNLGETTNVDTANLIEISATGSVSGTITNAGILANLSLESTTDGSIYTIDTNGDGTFTFQYIPAGTYTLTVSPSADSNLSVKILDDVVITEGEVTALGNITLE
ncbi:DUF4382 domain-containing protein [Zhouia sp. PK063]|uniref:DUF4382 domain-containing protein n=1 Tax=Zhouia sp. PK063 TaxID=3373602 RepID=UPI0037982E5A